MNDKNTNKAMEPPKQAPQSLSLRRISSQELLQEDREIIIVHEGNEYHLRLTNNSKLILTK